MSDTNVMNQCRLCIPLYGKKKKHNHHFKICIFSCLSTCVLCATRVTCYLDVSMIVTCPSYWLDHDLLWKSSFFGWYLITRPSNDTINEKSTHDRLQMNRYWAQIPHKFMTFFLLIQMRDTCKTRAHAYQHLTMCPRDEHTTSDCVHPRMQQRSPPQLVHRSIRSQRNILSWKIKST